MATTTDRSGKPGPGSASPRIIARRGTPHGTGLGRQRWPVERTVSWLHLHRRLRTRWEHRADLHHAFLSLTCSIICLRRLHTSL